MMFAMPFNRTMEIRPSRVLTEDEEEHLGHDEELEGVTWHIYWNNEPLPWHTQTKLQATDIALGCQWGAMETCKMMR